MVKYPPPPSNIGKRRSLSTPDGYRLGFVVEDELHFAQSDYPNKLIYLQRLAYEDGSPQLRLGYYIIGKKPGRRGRWVWGQYATIMPPKDFKRIIGLARKKGWM
jgi:hypothetical protein